MQISKMTWNADKDKPWIIVKINGKAMRLCVEEWGDGILRLIISKKERNSPPFLLGKGKKIKPEITEKRIVFAGTKTRFILHEENGWAFSDKSRVILHSPDDRYPAFEGFRELAPPLLLEDNAARISFSLMPDEPVYGGGETFGYLNKRKLKLDMRITDPNCLTTAPWSYKYVPLFWSPRGWGLFFCTNHSIQADIGSSTYISACFRVEEPEIDLFLLPGGPGDIMRHYWKLTGSPPLVPEWAMGVWWSRCMYRDASEVFEVIENLEKHGLEGSVISLDPLWLKNKKEWDRDACDFEWNDEDFGEMKTFASKLHEKGMKLCLWENPYVWLEGDSYKELKPYVMKDENGDDIKVEPPLGGMGIVDRMEKIGPWDFTSEMAWEKRKKLMRKLIKSGADCFKADYGESVPGENIHNLYPFLYLKNSWEALVEERGEEEAMLWARPGWSGCQRFPGCWAGDSACTFPAMASTLAGCLSLAASGFPWWSHDIGGFHHYAGKEPSPELYIRWAEMGLFSPLARFHGTSPREPWHFGKHAVGVIREMIMKRKRMIPYLRNQYHGLMEKGLPVARPIVMDYPHDPATYNMSTQFMLGMDHMVAPVLEEGVTERKVYIPEGDWKQKFVKGTKILKGPVLINCLSPLGSPMLFEKIKS